MMLDIVTWTEPGDVPVMVIRPRGLLNAETVEVLEQKARWAVAQHARCLVLDFSDVVYISSAGLRVIIYLFHALRTDAPEDSDAALRDGLRAGTYRSPHLKLARPQSRVREVLKLAGLPQFLEIHDTLADAIASFGGRPTQTAV